MTSPELVAAEALVARIEELLPKVTAGQWTSFYKHKYDEWHVSLPMSESGMKLALCPDGIQSENREADAAWIALFNPENVKVLLSALRRQSPAGHANTMEVTDEMASAFAVAAEMGDGNLHSDQPPLDRILAKVRRRIKAGLAAALTASPSPAGEVAPAAGVVASVPCGPGDTLLSRVINQVRADFAAAHEEICRLQGLDAKEKTWPEWSSIANTLRWFDEIDTALQAPAAPAADAVVTVTVDEARKLCERLEFDASWDKAGSGYYSLKRQVKAFEASPAADVVEPKRVGVIAHVDHGKTSLAAAIAAFHSFDGAGIRHPAHPAPAALEAPGGVVEKLAILIESARSKAAVFADPGTAYREIESDLREASALFGPKEFHNDMVRFFTALGSAPEGGWRAALEDARDFIIGLGQSPEAEGWPRDPYVVLAKIEAALSNPSAPGEVSNG